MAGDAHAQDPGNVKLNDEQLSLYQYFWASRNRSGIPRRTPTQAQYDLGWKRAKIKALMEEIQDAGYWSIQYNGIPLFDPEKSPGTLTPEWASPTYARTCVHGRQESQELLAKNVIPLPSPLRGDSAVPQHGIPHLSQKGYARLARRYGKDARDLVDEFSYLIRKSNGGFAPGGINAAALGSQFKRWMAVDEVTYPVIQQMIRIFIRDYASAKKGVPAWKLFLAQREKLYTQAQEQTKRQRVSDYWKRGDE